MLAHRLAAVLERDLVRDWKALVKLLQRAAPLQHPLFLFHRTTHILLLLILLLFILLLFLIRILVLLHCRRWLWEGLREREERR